jgi:hypothetical protein
MPGMLSFDQDGRIVGLQFYDIRVVQFDLALPSKMAALQKLKMLSTRNFNRMTLEYEMRGIGRQEGSIFVLQG